MAIAVTLTQRGSLTEELLFGCSSLASNLVQVVLLRESPWTCQMSGAIPCHASWFDERKLGFIFMARYAKIPQA